MFVLLALLACGTPPADRAMAALTAEGLSGVELDGNNGVYEFTGKRGDELCAGMVTVAPDGSARVEKDCRPPPGPEEVRMLPNASAQGRERARGCDGGSWKDCALLGTDYRDGTNGIPGDGPDAIRLFTAACDNGAYHGCTYLAEVYEQGELLPKDAAKALALYTRSCDLGSQVGCAAIGRGGEGAAAVEPE